MGTRHDRDRDFLRGHLISRLTKRCQWADMPKWGETESIITSCASICMAIFTPPLASLSF